MRETWPQIEKAYLDKGKIRYAVVNFPLPFHPLAPKAVEAARCAQDQGKYWEMHNLMLIDQRTLDNLAAYARKAHLDIENFEQCLNSDKYADAVKKNKQLALTLGVSGVPGFVIAAVDPNNHSQFKGISRIQGAMPFPIFQRALDQALQEIQ